MKLKTMLPKSLLAASATGLLALAAVLPARADYSNTVQSFHPIGYWRMDDTGLGSIPVDRLTNSGTLGAAGNGVYQANPAHGTNGALVGSSDKATYFNGGQNGLIDYNPTLNTTVFSAEIWAYPAAANAAAAVMSSGQPAGSPNRSGWVLYQVNDTWSFRPFTGNANITVTGNATGINSAAGTLTLNAWQHLVIVNDGTNCLLYINGALANSFTTNNYAAAASGGTTIGCRYSAVNYFNGILDECAFYTNALSAQDVLDHYNNGTNALSSPTSYYDLVQTKAPVGYWRLDEPVFVAPSVLGAAVNNGSWGSGADGAYQAGTTPLVPGVPYQGFAANNNGCKFDGSFTSYINIPAQPVATSNFTEICWIKRPPGGIYWSMLWSHPNQPGWTSAADSTANPLNTSIPPTGINFNDHGDTQGLGRGFCAMNLCFKGGVYNTGPYGITPYGSTTNEFCVPTNWTFVVMTVCPTNATLYMNGRSYTWNPITTAYPDGYGAHDFSTCDALIGRKQQLYGFGGGEVSGFVGTIDEVALFDQFLTHDQIAQIYAAAQPPPIIVYYGQPVGPTPPVYEGTTLALTVTAETGLLQPTYQWFKSGSLLTGQTATNLVINPLVTTDSGNYSVVVSYPWASVTSSVVAVTVLTSPPLITLQPQPAARYQGTKQTFSVAAVGSVPFTYQWYFNPVSTSVTNAIAGATNSTYTIADVETGNLGLYSVRVTNLRGSTNSAAAALTLLPLSPGYAAEVIGSGPVSYWQFNEGSGTTAYDYIGGVNGTNVGGVVLTAAGPTPANSFLGMANNNLAYTFNGTTGMVNLPKPFALNSSAYSIVAWVRAEPQTTNRSIIGQASGWAWRLDSANYLALELVAAPRATAFAGATYVAADNAWHQAVAVYDGAKEYLYVDGVQDPASPVAASGLVGNNANLVTIGAQGAASAHWLGDLDEVAVYNRALTGAEIANLYQIATAGPAAPQIAAEPVSQTVFAGQPVSFSVSASGGAPYTYQWTHAGTNLPAAVASGRTLSIPSAYYTDTGTYQVWVTNSVGWTNSQVVSLTVLPPPTFANFTNDLVLHLKFDNNYADSSGRGNNGAAVGTLPGPTFVAGMIGGTAVHVVSEVDTTDPNALVCTNANYVTLGMPPDLLFGSATASPVTNMTVAYWVKMPAGELYTEYPVLCDSPGGTFSPGCYFGTDWNSGGEGGGMAWWISSPGAHISSATVPGGPYLINDGNWHHVVVSLDRTAMAVTYLDGVQIDSRSIAGGDSFDQPTGTWNIGQDTSGAYPWSGVAGSRSECVIDDMGIWRRALSPTEAQSIYIVGQSYARTFDKYGPVSITLNPPSANNGQSIELIWQAGTLQQSTNVTGPYLPVGGAAAPYYTVKPGTGNKFYRVQL